MVQEAEAPTGAVVVTQPARAVDTIRRALEERIDDIAAVLPEGMKPERFIRTAILAVSKSPDLLACSQASIVRSIVEAAELGLEPTGSLSRAWLVPFHDKDKPRPEAQLIIGYQGLADLMRDTGRIRQVWAEVVYEGDEFAYELGMHPVLRHVPAHQTEDPTKITYAYACARFADGEVQFHVMSKAQVDAIRARSRAKNAPAWMYSYAQMARKSALRQLANYVPLSTKAQGAIERDDEREFSVPVAAPVPKGSSLREQLAAKAAEVSAAPQQAPAVDGEVVPLDAAIPQSADAARRSPDGRGAARAASGRDLGLAP